jgi:hypothetical protein
MIGRLSYYVIGTQKKSLYFLIKKKLKKEKEGKRKYSQKKRIPFNLLLDRVIVTAKI